VAGSSSAAKIDSRRKRRAQVTSSGYRPLPGAA
jgi:hypothetical protein